MCGIAGIVAFDGRPVAYPLLDRLSERLRHRGPDDQGLLGWSGEGAVERRPVDSGDRPWRIALVHRRLSIIDTSSRGHQPMSSPDGLHHLVLNGEIYNYRELRPELEKQGWRFISDSDTEVLLAAWSCWGRECLNRLIGMFSFGVLDVRERALWLVRDFFGIKPLYYVRPEGRLAFASEIPALLELPGVEPRADPDRVYQYLRYGVTDHGDRTLFAAVRQVPAAHWMRVGLDNPGAGDVQVRRYWDPTPRQQQDISFVEAAGQVRQLFLKSVALHLRSDVPVGTALSGGIDSSAILAAMRQAGGPGQEVHAVSYVADRAEINEERWVDLAGRASGAVVHKVRLDSSDLASELDELIRVQGEPFGSSSIFAQYRVFQEARRQGLKVMLDGQGADELFAGYRHYLAARLASLVKQGRLSAALSLWRRMRGHVQGDAGGRLRQAVGFLTPAVMQGPLRRWTGKSFMPGWLNGAWFARQGVAGQEMFRHASRGVLREQLLQALTETSLPMLLRYEDRNSMAFSVESRVPFLTPELAECVLSLPEEHLVDARATTKAVFRQAMRGLAPDAVLDRGDKIGFATPEADWMRQLTPWVRSIADSEAAVGLPALNGERVRREFNRFGAGQGVWKPYYWRCLNLIRWTQQMRVQF